MRAPHLLTLALLVGTAACEPATGPQTTAELDTKAALADYQALEKVFSSDGWAGLQSLGGRTPTSTNAAVAAVRSLPTVAAGGSGRRFALDLFNDMAAARGANVPLAKTIISDRHIGKTLVYDSALDHYVVDPTRTGAPKNGVRFIVYEVDAASRPIGGREIGYADLLDEGANSGEAIALRLVLVTRGTTMLDYRMRVELRDTSGTIDVSGFAAEGASRLDFTIGLEGKTAGGRTLIDADFDLALKPQNFNISGTVRGVEEGRDGEGMVNVNVRHQQNTLKVDLKGSGGLLDGSIKFNGKIFVTISGSSKDPTLRGPSGQPLTGPEVLVVLSIMDIVDSVFDLIEDLVKPVDNLVVLGWIL